MKTTRSVLLVSLSLSLSLSLACSLATAAPAETQAATSTAAVAPAPSARQLEADQAVKQLLVAMKYRELLTSMIQQTAKSAPLMMRQMAEQSIGQNSKLSAEQKTQAFKSLEKELPGMTAAVTTLLADPTLFDEMEASVAPLYTKYFSAAEIRQITAFYQSGVGLKMTSVMPQIMQDSARMWQQLMAPRLGKMMQQMLEAAAH